MKYVLGVDSGGTKYLIKACGMDGTLLASHIGPTAYHYRVGCEEAARRIRENVSACLALFGGKAEDCAFLMVGTTGMDMPEDEAVIRSFYAALPGFEDVPMAIVNDAEVAHHAATGGVGVTVIAGTGSIAFGRDSLGQTARVGGWPICIGGDEGSGAWIAAQALAQISRVLDGSEPDSPMTRTIRRHLAIDSKQALMDIALSIGDGTFKDPGIARWVNETAAEDPVALDILTRAGQIVAEMAKGVIRQLHFPLDRPLIAGVWGSVIVNCRACQEAFRASVTQAYPQAEVRIPTCDAADGAVQMAFDYLRQKA